MKMYIWPDIRGLHVVIFANSTKEAREKAIEAWPNQHTRNIVDRRPRIDKIPDVMLVNLFNYYVDGLRKTPPCGN